MFPREGYQRRSHCIRRAPDALRRSTKVQQEAVAHGPWQPSRATSSSTIHPRPRGLPRCQSVVAYLVRSGSVPMR